MRIRVVFNVGGTRFETYASTIQSVSWNDVDLLNMLLRRDSSAEIFIDRDPASFQGILNIYRGSGPVCTDPDELGFYCIPLPKEEVSKKTKREEIEDELKSVLEDNKRSKEEGLERCYDQYANLMKLLLDNDFNLQFVYADTSHEFSAIPSTLNGVRYSEYSFYQSSERDAYARKLGYRVIILKQTEVKATRFDYLPASNYNGSYTNRKKTCITVKLEIL